LLTVFILREALISIPQRCFAQGSGLFFLM
jgi:hypothetical protein